MFFYKWFLQAHRNQYMSALRAFYSASVSTAIAKKKTPGSSTSQVSFYKDVDALILNKNTT